MARSSDDTHPLYELLDTMGALIHAYEQEHYRIPVSSGPDTLAYLMQEHALKQSDLPEVESQGVVSEILSGQRTLNVRQIQLLSARFHVPPAVFFYLRPDRFGDKITHIFHPFFKFSGNYSGGGSNLNSNENQTNR